MRHWLTTAQRLCSIWLAILLVATTVRMVMEVPNGASWLGWEVLRPQGLALAAAILILTMPRRPLNPVAPENKDG